MTADLTRRIEDAVLAWIQRRCRHEGHFVAADVLEGAYEADVAVRWCRRCGAVRVDWHVSPWEPSLQRPDPNMWRGR